MSRFLKEFFIHTCLGLLWITKRASLCMIVSVHHISSHRMQEAFLTSVCRYRDIKDRLGDLGLGFCTASRRSSCIQ